MTIKSITDLHIAVLCGGVGSEREVSLLSGENIYNALMRGGCRAILHDLNPQDLSILEDKAIDVFFLALHGQFGEDGQLQAHAWLEYEGQAVEISHLHERYTAFQRLRRGD